MSDSATRSGAVGCGSELQRPTRFEPRWYQRLASAPARFGGEGLARRRLSGPSSGARRLRREERELVLIRDAQSYAQFSCEYPADDGCAFGYVYVAEGAPVGFKGSRDGPLG
jgi:hypothetical protein